MTRLRTKVIPDSSSCAQPKVKADRPHQRSNALSIRFAVEGRKRINIDVAT